MERERWLRMEEIFSSAAEFTGAEREDFLRNSCGDDEETLAEIRELLAEHENPSTSLDTPIFETGLKVLDGNSTSRLNGQTVGNFRFVRLIGRGGMGEIYEAEDLKLERKVAIKLVNELFALDPERIRRFRKEANAAARVSHQNVAKLYELFEIDGENLIVMEFVEGMSLRQHLNEPMLPSKAIGIAIQIASALAAAHAAGVVHRDIKPENIIITPDEIVKVLDFGLAKLVEPIGDGAIQIPGGERVDLTMDMSTELGALIGTPAYMSPEQIRGGDVDTQTDIWSFGVLLYEMLTGHMPFRGSTKIDLIAAILMSEPTPLRLTGIGTRGDLSKLVLTALRKERSERYPNATALVTDLERIRKKLVPAAKGNTGFKRADKRIRSILLLGIVISSIVVFWQLSRSYFAMARSGPVSYWAADGNANDLVGGNNGTLKGTASFALGSFGEAFSLDGSNGFIEVPDSPALSITGPLTLEAKIKLNSNTEQQALIEKYDEPGLNGYLFRIVGTKLQAAVCDAAFGCRDFGTANTTVTVGDWHHVAAVFDGTTIRLYLDGIIDGSIATDTMPTDGVTSLKIGARSDDTDKQLNGLIDEVRIYSRALSPAEILDNSKAGNLPVPRNGLISYWQADGNSNDVLNRNHGELLNGATYRQGISGQAFSFDGVDDLFQAPTSGFPTGNSDRTMMMWVMADDFVTVDAFFGGYGGFGTFYQSYLLGTARRLPYITNWGDGTGASTPLDSGRWYHVAATTDINNVTSLYLDGNLVKTEQMPLSTPINSQFYSGRIPGEKGDSRRLQGAVDDIQIYDRALAAAEILALYLANKPPDG